MAKKQKKNGRHAVDSGKTPEELLVELSKKPGEAADYLEAGRAYRCEENVFEDFTDEERAAVFGKPPATVWENVKTMRAYPEKMKVVTAGGSLNETLVDSFVASILYRWKNELMDRIIPGTEMMVKGFRELEDEDASDKGRWKAIKAKRIEIAKDTEDGECICTRLKKALNEGNFDLASDLQLEMMKKTEELEKEYRVYELNILDD